MPDQILIHGQCIVTSSLKTSTQEPTVGVMGIPGPPDSAHCSTFSPVGCDLDYGCSSYWPLGYTGQQASAYWSACPRAWHFWDTLVFCFQSDSIFPWAPRHCLTKCSFCIHWIRYTLRHIPFSLYTSMNFCRSSSFRFVILFWSMFCPNIFVRSSSSGHFCFLFKNLSQLR